MVCTGCAVLLYDTRYTVNFDKYTVTFELDSEMTRTKVDTAFRQHYLERQHHMHAFTPKANNCDIVAVISRFAYIYIVIYTNGLCLPTARFGCKWKRHDAHMPVSANKWSTSVVGRVHKFPIQLRMQYLVFLQFSDHAYALMMAEAN